MWYLLGRWSSICELGFILGDPQLFVDKLSEIVNDPYWSNFIAFVFAYGTMMFGAILSTFVDVMKVALPIRFAILLVKRSDRRKIKMLQSQVDELTAQLSDFTSNRL